MNRYYYYTGVDLPLKTWNFITYVYLILLIFKFYTWANIKSLYPGTEEHTTQVANNYFNENVSHNSETK